MGCQVHNGYFHWDVAVGWQVVGVEIIWALVLILLVYHDWMNEKQSDALQPDCTDTRIICLQGVGSQHCCHV